MDDCALVLVMSTKFPVELDIIHVGEVTEESQVHYLLLDQGHCRPMYPDMPSGGLLRRSSVEGGGCPVVGYCIFGRTGRRQQVSWKTWSPVRPPCSILKKKKRESYFPSLCCRSVAEVAAPSKRGPSAFILASLIETELSLPLREDLTGFL